MTIKVIVAGSRTLNKASYVDTAVAQAFNKWMSEYQDNWKQYTQPEIVSGGARGVDFEAEMYAKRKSLPLKVFMADWDTHGKKAGMLRNHDMASYADRLIAIWDGASKGTLNMISLMVSKNKPVFVYCP